MNTPDQLIDVSIVRDFPIEDILQKLSDNVWASMEGSPRPEHLGPVEALLDASEKGLEAILRDDSKCRPTLEWMNALEIVEGIRDECLETIEMLKCL